MDIFIIQGYIYFYRRGEVFNQRYISVPVYPGLWNSVYVLVNLVESNFVLIQQKK